MTAAVSLGYGVKLQVEVEVRVGALSMIDSASGSGSESGSGSWGRGAEPPRLDTLVLFRAAALGASYWLDLRNNAGVRSGADLAAEPLWCLFASPIWG